jgi:DNA-directed RNA polymerase specialized sigma24 family protein
MRLADAARASKMAINVLSRRLSRGWSVERAMCEKPIRRKRLPPKVPETKAERMAKKTYKLTPEERVKLVNMYLQGLKGEYIAAVFGIRRESVNKAVRRAGAPYRKDPRVQSADLV